MEEERVVKHFLQSLQWFVSVSYTHLDVYKRQVYASSGKDCVFTMVEGRILYDHGIYTDGLYADTAAEMRDLVKWVKNSD